MGDNSKQSGGVTTASFFTRRIGAGEIAGFCMQLSVMLKAGVSLHRSLQVLAAQTTHARFKSVLENLLRDVQSGSSFARALARHTDVFDPLFIATTEVGQETGRLADSLSELALYLEKVNALKRKFRQAMTYPLLVLVVAAAAVTFLLVFIVPAFAEMFKSFQVELPSATRLVMDLSDIVVGYGVYAVLAAAVMAFMLRGAFASPAAREWAMQKVLHIPVVGSALRKSYVARFCRTLGTLLQADVSLVDALTITQRIFTERRIRGEIGGILKHVRQGKSVAEQMVESSLFPPMVAQMIAVGEETSELDAMLLKVAEYNEKELDGAVEALSSVVEPVIIVLLGGVVAAILISMYMPMFELVGIMQGG